MGRRLERTETHLAWTPNIDNRRDADGVVDPEVLELVGLEVDVRGVVLVRDRPRDAHGVRRSGRIVARLLLLLPTDRRRVISTSTFSAFAFHFYFVTASRPGRWGERLDTWVVIGREQEGRGGTGAYVPRTGAHARQWARLRGSCSRLDQTWFLARRELSAGVRHRSEQSLR